MIFHLYPQSEAELDTMIELVSYANAKYRIKTEYATFPPNVVCGYQILIDTDCYKFEYIRWLIEKRKKEIAQIKNMANIQTVNSSVSIDVSLDEYLKKVINSMPSSSNNEVVPSIFDMLNAPMEIEKQSNLDKIKNWWKNLWQ